MGNFYSEVISLDARFRSSSLVDDPALLEPVTRQLVQQLLATAQRIGIALMIYETYRSQQRQQELFNNGATKLRAVGVHHYGLACDIVRSVNGEPSWKGDFSFLGNLAQNCGLIWGGDWGVRKSSMISSTAFMCSVARLPSKTIFSLASGIRKKPTIPMRTQIFCWQPEAHAVRSPAEQSGKNGKSA